MVGVSASVNLPLHHIIQKFSSGTGWPGWSRKKGHKTVVVWWLWCDECLQQVKTNNIMSYVDRVCNFAISLFMWWHRVIRLSVVGCSVLDPLLLTVCVTALSTLISSPPLNHHFYAGDTRFFSFHPLNFDPSITYPQNAWQQTSTLLRLNFSLLWTHVTPDLILHTLLVTSALFSMHTSCSVTRFHHFPNPAIMIWILLYPLLPWF